MIPPNRLFPPVCAVCRRFQRIMADAPWSSYDLLASLIVFGVGVFLWVTPQMFSHIGGVYQPMANVAEERAWGLLFIGCGLWGLGVTLWGRAPGFLCRLSGRMATAFCLLILAGNNVMNLPPPLSSVTYLMLSLWAVWGILRTRNHGR